MKKSGVTYGVVCAVACQVLFGFSFLFTKRVTLSISPMVLLSWRFIVAFLLFTACAMAGIVKLDFKGKSIAPLVWVAVFQPTLYFIGETFGVKLTTASESGTIIACIPIAALISSAVFLKEPPTRRQIAGVSIAAAGILIIVLTKGVEATFNPLGYAMLVLAVFSHSLYSVFSQKACQFTSVEKTYVMVAFGAVIFTVAALFQSLMAGTTAYYLMLPFKDTDFLVSVIYLGLGCSVAAFIFYNAAISVIGTNRTASFAGISTVVTVIAGIVVLKEEFSMLQRAGAALVIIGVYIANSAAVSPHGSQLT
jgi:drug/metabolite transporter (DMT)-like permease